MIALLVVDCCLAGLQLLDFLPPPQFNERLARGWEHDYNLRCLSCLYFSL